MKNKAEGFKKYIDKEVFVFSSTDNDWGEIFITNNWSTIVDFMKARQEQSLDVQVYHGVLTSAICIPEDRLNKDVFLVITSPDEGDDRGCCLEAEAQDTVSEIAETIEKIVDETSILSAYATEKITIDNIFLLYGKALPLFVCPNDDELDEEVIDAGNKICEKMEDIKMFNKN